MTLINRIRQQFISGWPNYEMNAATAYNWWAKSYDTQPGNLMLDLDEELFSWFLKNVSLKDKAVVDIGCGTGRHWKKIQEQRPRSLCGYDVSDGMLSMLTAKFPHAVTYKLEADLLPQLGNGSVDIIVSTLTVAHIEHIGAAINEWSRVLKNDGEIIITDYHPEALARGGKRTFSYNGKTVAIKNYIHSVEKIFDAFQRVGFQIVELKERVIDGSMRRYYEEKNAVHIFEKFQNVPIIYGMRLRKKNAAS